MVRVWCAMGMAWSVELAQQVATAVAVSRERKIRREMGSIIMSKGVPTKALKATFDL